MKSSDGLIDVNAFVGAYPFRRVPGTMPEALLAAMDRVGIGQAWVSHLPSLFWKDPAEGNDWLYHICAGEPRFLPVPSINPELATWPGVIARARESPAPAIRCDPHFLAMDPTGRAMAALISACGESAIPLMMAVRLEDSRQRHPNDTAPDLAPSAVRTMIRMHPGCRLIVTHADRGFIEEVHFGSTPEESARIWWDISWLWGPPEDHLRTLVHTIGAERFLLGTGMPLRLPENGVAKLDLSNLSAAERTAIERGNAGLVLRRG